MQPSRRQQAILDTWETTDENILISAVAGSGKTSTLLMLLEKCNHRTLFVAFNKSVQEEIQAKIDERGLKQGKAMTLHSLGLAAIRATRKKFNINNNKNWNLIKKLQAECRGVYRSTPDEDRLRLSYSLIDMNDVSRMFLTNDIEEIRKYMKSMDRTLVEHSQLEHLWGTFLELREESYKETTMEIDFQDMIYLPAIENYEIPVHPFYLMIDECQDMNLSQHKLIDNMLSQGTVYKWIAVGDRNQAIYGFAGASSNSFDLFLEKPGTTTEMPLDICYRCARKIVESANQVYDVMEAATDEDGIVSVLTDIQAIQPNSMVICRNSQPLFQLYFQLLGMGKPCYINGNDLMNYLIKFLKPYIKDTVYSAKVEMEYKLLDLRENDSDEGRLRRFIFEENYNNFVAVAKNMCESTDSIEFLIDRLKHLFEDRANAIMLCTIHKAKGLENRVVYILNESLIPSKFAKSEEQQKQERNLKYVARTRAKEEMYFVEIKPDSVEVEEL